MNRFSTLQVTHRHAAFARSERSWVTIVNSRGERCVDSSGVDTDDLSFDKATFTHDASAGPPCANCNSPLGEQYWQWQTRSVCGKCRGQIAEMLERSRSPQAFGRAVVLGGLAALGCGIAYAIFVAVTKFQLALLTIGIAFVIARVMRRCSSGVGGRKYQILAVVLTYAASAMGYAPAVYSEFAGQASKTTAKAAPPSAATNTDQSRAAAAPASATQARKSPLGAGALMLGLGVLLAITLAAPFLAATHAPIGLLIVGFGLWEAWKLSRGLPLTLDGPYRAAGAVPEASTT